VEFMNECRVFWLKRNMNERGKNAHKSLSGFAGKSVGKANRPNANFPRLPTKITNNKKAQKAGRLTQNNGQHCEAHRC